MMTQPVSQPVFRISALDDIERLNFNSYSFQINEIIHMSPLQTLDGSASRLDDGFQLAQHKGDRK